MSYLAFVFSTGRCGTQWLAHALRHACNDLVEVAHEPLHDDYEPRHMLGISAGSDTGLPEAVAKHVEQLERLGRPYVECGHPCWSAVPHLLRRFPERARVIHLVRHPVPTCLSWLTQSAYEPPLLPHLHEKVLLSPFDEGVQFPEYRDRWESLTRFEKCVYYWSEVNALGIATGRKVQVPWLLLQFESLFDGDGLAKLLGFLGLPLTDEMLEQRSCRQDEYRYVTTPEHDWRSIHDHPRAVEIAGQLGYEVDDVDESALHLRYVEGR